LFKPVFRHLCLSAVVFVATIPAAMGGLMTAANFSATMSAAMIHPGEALNVIVVARIDPGWHLYSLVPTPPPGPSTTRLSITGSGVQIAGQIAENPTIQRFDPNFEKPVSFHVSRAIFYVPVRLSGAMYGPREIDIDVHYQTCNDRICLPPQVVVLRTLVNVSPGVVRAAYRNAPLPPQQNGNLFVFLLSAFIAGLLALLTPCVFPLIPITITSFVKQADGNARRLVYLSVGYSLGIIILYVLVGLLTAIFIGASGIGRIAANPWVNLFAFVIFLVFALSFFETIRIELPGNLSKLQSAARRQSGIAGLAMLGVVFVLASFTCTAPFIGTLLVAAAGGSLLRPVSGMLVFAFAFVSPFIVLSIFPTWIKLLPKSGLWLVRVKAVLGFVELIGALKFLSNADLIWQWKLLTQPVMLGLWAIVFTLVALYLTNVFRFGVVAETETIRTKLTFARGFAAAFFVTCAIYCLWGLCGRPLNPYVAAFLPPVGYGDARTFEVTGLPWLTNYDASLALARRESKPILIDFTGYTCTNCRLNEKQVFPNPSVQRDLSKYVLVQLYTDGGEDASANENLELSKFGTVALPLYGVLDAGSASVIAQTAGIQSVGSFTSFLQSAVGSTSPAWMPYTAIAVGSSERNGRPVIIDFTASWCTNCKAIENTVFTDSSAKQALTGFDTYRCDLTDFYSPSNAFIEKKYDIASLPAVVFLTKTNTEAPGTRITGLISVSSFLRRLDKARL
jgi:thiol:disulfide interchange protein